MRIVSMYQSFFDTSAFTRQIVTKRYYQAISLFLDRAEFSFMNYGYAELGASTRTVVLDAADEPHRLPIQLYHHLASSVSLEGKDVLEVSCGRGGGAAFVKRYHHPHSLVGVDRTSQAIAYCRRKHHLPGLSFLQCDAEEILYGDECFDAVTNVEASHLYASMDKFLAEVRRVLRRGGHLLLADKRTQAEMQLFHRQLSNSGLRVVREVNISANVLQSIRLQHEKRNHVLQTMLPPHLNWLAVHLFGADGSHLADALENGSTVYLSLVLRKD
jgi:SAM-dependent methyltransferase